MIQSQMCKHPKCIGLRIPHNKQISYDEIDALSISHGREVIGYPFEYIFEGFLFFLFELKGSIEILFDLRETFVILCRLLDLMI